MNQLKEPVLQRIEDKLKESEFFLQKMKDIEHKPTNKIEDDRDQLRFYTSAFLNAVRSPQQYLLTSWELPPSAGSKKSSIEPIAKAWYDAAVTLYPVLGFIADERNLNIHHKPTAPDLHINTSGIIYREGPNYPMVDTVHQEWTDYDGQKRDVLKLPRFRGQ